MAEVVEMLTNSETTAAVPGPNQPAFINSTTQETISTTFRTYYSTT